VTVEVIEFLVQIIIASPDSYRVVLTVLSDIMYVQPKEAMTQNALNQVIAITTVTGEQYEMIFLFSKIRLPPLMSP
jgi:hypothetical protein